MKRITSYFLVALSLAILAGCASLGLGGTSKFNGTSGIIMFQNDSTTLNTAGQSMVSKLAAYLRKTKGKVVVEGHTDANGSAKYNEALSLRRANTVKAALARGGVKADRIATKGYGFTKLAVANAKTQAEHAKNRRAVVIFYNSCKPCRD